MNRRFIVICLLSLLPMVTHAQGQVADGRYYRELTMRIRTSGAFKIPMPANGDMIYDYSLEIGDPIYSEPIISDVPVGTNRPGKFWRSFYDRVWLKDGSFVTVGGEQIPLTCIFVSGQDNRYSGSASPLYPQFILRIFIVANDFTCQGPIRPGWPETGGRRENWDTYVHYEVRDPTIMLPVESKLRYRFNEFNSILVR